MASRPVTVSAQEDFLTCRICFEVFTDPRILPCLHTYCFRCIRTHAIAAQVDGRTVACPECREPFSDTASNCVPRTNVFINGLAEIVKVKTDSDLICTACNLRGARNKAKVKCLDCGDYLCSTCSDGHNASSLTWKHEKISLYDIKQGTYDEKLRQLQKIKCLKHEDKDVEYYCESCCQPVCLTCVLITHRDHKCQTVSDAIAEKMANIISLTDNIRDDHSKLRRKESNVQASIDTSKRNTEEKISAVREKTQQKINKLVTERDAAIMKLKAKNKETEKHQNSELEKLQLQKETMGNCLSFCDNILKRGRDEEILMLEGMITARLRQLQGPAKNGTGSMGLSFFGEEEIKERKNIISGVGTDDEQSKTSHKKTPDMVKEMFEKFKTTNDETGSSWVNPSVKLNVKRSMIFFVPTQI